MSVMHGLNLSSDFQEQAARTPWLTDDTIQRFMDACRGDEHKALQRIKATVVRVYVKVQVGCREMQLVVWRCSCVGA